MKLELNINRKSLVVILIVAAMLVVAVGYMTGFVKFGKQVAFKSEREASDAITNVSTGVEQVSSIIEDIDKKLGK